MTIASDYQNLADYCAGFAHRGEPIPPRTASVLATALLDLAERAKLLEHSTILAKPIDYTEPDDGC